MKQEDRFLRIRFDSGEYLYHGTIDLFGELIRRHGIKIIKRSKNGVDFGPGFYLTVGNELQAKEWAERKATNPAIPNTEILNMLQMTVRDFLGSRHTIKPCIVKFRISDPIAWMSLRKIIFTKDDSSWKRHVWMWRQARVPPEQYDWIFGPVADGGINKEAFQGIEAYPSHNQLSVHNEDVTQYLELVEVISW